MANNVTKAELVDYVAAKTGLTKLEVKACLEGFLEGLKNALVQGRRIEIRGFGVFANKARRARIARNPRTGEKVALDDRFIPHFKPSDELIDEVNKALKSRVGTSSHSATADVSTSQS